MARRGDCSTRASWERAWARHAHAERRFSRLSGQLGREWEEHLVKDPWNAEPTSRLLQLQDCVDEAGRHWRSSRPLSWTGWQISLFLDAKMRAKPDLVPLASQPLVPNEPLA